MPQGVFTRMKRITFVEKSASEVGDQTKYPLQVTLDQIAEVYYRVKDAYYTGGQFTWDITSPAASASFSAPTSAPSTRVLDIASGIQRRGYNRIGAYVDNGAIYDAGTGIDYSDVDDKERSMWRDGYNTLSDYPLRNPSDYQEIITAFTYWSDELYHPDNQWWGENTTGGVIGARFNGEVAVVKVNPADSFVAPTNLYYLWFEFYWEDADAILSFGGGTNMIDGYWGDQTSTAVQSVNYILRLSTGDLTFPCYMFDPGITNLSGTDIIHEAVEWFPYQDGDGAVWDATTGLKVPDGALILDLEDAESSGLFLLLF